MEHSWGFLGHGGHALKRDCNIPLYLYSYFPSCHMNWTIFSDICTQYNHQEPPAQTQTMHLPNLSLKPLYAWDKYLHLYNLIFSLTLYVFWVAFETEFLSIDLTILELAVQSRLALTCPLLTVSPSRMLELKVYHYTLHMAHIFSPNSRQTQHTDKKICLTFISWTVLQGSLSCHKWQVDFF